MEKGKQIINQGTNYISGLVDVSKNGMVKTIFDNIIWVFIIMGTLTILYIVYLLKSSFNVSTKLKEINDTYKEFKHFDNLDKKSISGKEQKYDEIEPHKHTLCDVYIISSASSYLIGWKMLDFVSMEMFLTTIKYGARYVEIDINLNKKQQLVVAYGIKEGQWILTLNEIELDDFCKQLGEKMFNENYFINNKDPLILYLNINSPKDRMENIYQYLYQNLKTHLLDTEYSLDGDKNVLDLPLDKLYKKLIIICNGKIVNTNMTKIVNLKLGDRVKRITYDELKSIDENKSIAFNKNNLTIVEQNYSVKCLNANPRIGFDKGCQIISMHFQRADTYMIEYLNEFYGKSFQLKPFEFTRFSDEKLSGYDKNKIAFYYNQNEYDTIAQDFTDNLGNKEIDKECCNLILDSEMEIHFPKGSPIELQNSVNHMITKLKQLDGKLEQEIIDMQNISVNNETNIQTIRNFINENYIIFEDNNLKNILDSRNTPSPSPSNVISEEDFYYFKYSALYKSLLKKLSKLLEIERKKEFDKDGFQDVCFGLAKNDCVDKKLCDYSENKTDEKCKAKTANVPYQHLCLPKHEINRDNCCGEEQYSNLGLRKLYHKIHTQNNFSGKWSSVKGIIEIPEEFNNTCEFKFTTNHDNKEFTMFIVNEDGKYITLDENSPYNVKNNKINFIDYDKNDDNIRAKGTFVDKELRNLEETNNLPQLPYHGFCDIQMSSNTGDAKEDNEIFLGYREKEELGTKIKSCQYRINPDPESPSPSSSVIQTKNNDAFIGVYQYTQNVYDIEKKEKSSPEGIYTRYLNQKYDYNKDNFNLNDEILYIGADLLNESDIEKNKKNKKKYCYKMVSADCNNDLQKFFKREIKTKFEDISSSPSEEKFEKIDKGYIDKVFSIEPPAFQEDFSNYETKVEETQSEPSHAPDKYVDYFSIKYEKDDYCLGTYPVDAIECKNDNGTECSKNKLYVGKCKKPKDNVLENENYHFQVKYIDDSHKIIERKTPFPKLEQSKTKTCEELKEYKDKLYAEIDARSRKQPVDTFVIGHENKAGIYYYDSDKHEDDYEHSMELEEVNDKYLIKAKKDPYEDSTPSDCETTIKKGRCLSMKPYCKGDMETKYGDKFSESDNKKYTFKFDKESHFGNVGFVECNKKDDKQLWSINTLKKEKEEYPIVKLCVKKTDTSNAGSCIEEWKKKGTKMEKIKSC